VGASDKPGALGATLLTNLANNGYSGAIYPVNPKREEIMGLRCYPSVDALPEGVDVAVLAIPRAGVLDAVRGLAARKAGGVVIFSAGFAEGARKGWPNSTRSPGSRRGGLVVEGPNCLGLVNYVDRVPLTFVETNAVPPGDRRAVGIVSQSVRWRRCWAPCCSRAMPACPIRYRPATRRRAAWRTMSTGWSISPIPM
jgi:acyl-CoA synthetase (NDP forming)